MGISLTRSKQLFQTIHKKEWKIVMALLKSKEKSLMEQSLAEIIRMMK